MIVHIATPTQSVRRDLNVSASLSPPDYARWPLAPKSPWEAVRNVVRRSQGNSEPLMQHYMESIYVLVETIAATTTLRKILKTRPEIPDEARDSD